MVHACSGARVWRAALAVTVLLLTLVAVGILPQVAGAAVASGIADPTLTQPGARMNATVQAEALDQIGPQLGALGTCASSSRGPRPSPHGAGDPAGELYLAGVDQAVALAKANGLKVIVTFAYVPEWASNRTLLVQQPYGEEGGYDSATTR